MHVRIYIYIYVCIICICMYISLSLSIYIYIYIYIMLWETDTSQCMSPTAHSRPGLFLDPACAAGPSLRLLVDTILSYITLTYTMLYYIILSHYSILRQFVLSYMMIHCLPTGSGQHQGNFGACLLCRRGWSMGGPQSKRTLTVTGIVRNAVGN